MHILLAMLGALVTLLVLLYRLAAIGIDLGGLNPFARRRSRSWQQKYESNPLFTLEDSREIAAVLLTGMAKIDGDLTAGEKHALLGEFEHSFSMTPKQASELLSSTVYLLGDLDVISNRADELLARYGERLGPDQIDSLLGMLGRVAALEGGPTEQQSGLLARIRQALAPTQGTEGTWA